jgi:hypothetical protein
MKHITKVELDHQAGGWVATCSCGWSGRRPSWYKRRSIDRAKRHLEESSR